MFMKANGQYYISKNSYQSSLSIILSCLFLVHNLGSYRNFLCFHFSHDFVSPLDIFYVVAISLNFSFQLLSLKLLWLNQSKFLNLVNFLKKNNTEVFKINKKSCSISFCHLLFVLIAMYAIYDASLQIIPPFIVEISDSLWSNKTIPMTRFTFFLINFTESQKTVELNQTNWLDYPLIIMFSIGCLQR